MDPSLPGAAILVIVIDHVQVQDCWLLVILTMLAMATLELLDIIKSF